MILAALFQVHSHNGDTTVDVSLWGEIIFILLFLVYCTTRGAGGDNKD